MFLSSDLYIWLCVSILNGFSVHCYNQLQFCPDATWNPNGTTFVNYEDIDKDAWSIFVDLNNTIYVADKTAESIKIWQEGNSTIMKIIDMNGTSPHSLFVTVNGDIHVDVSNEKRIDVWTVDALNETTVMETVSSCFGIFVDIDETIYCSLHDRHKIVAKSINETNLFGMDLVGTGCAGMTSDTLNHPWGIFVDTNFTLYVADHKNDRIQKFYQGEKNGTTIAGMGAPNTIELNGPTGILLDADNYLFIVDRWKNRIIRSGSNGFHCIISCQYRNYLSPDFLNSPISMSFDTYGNIYVMDTGNRRVQIFALATNSCDDSSTTAAIISSSIEIEGESTIFESTEAIQTLSSTVPTLIRSFNQPTFCFFPAWDPEPIVIANRSLIGGNAFGVFVDTNNTIYAVARSMNQILVWPNGNDTLIKCYGEKYQDSYGIFITTLGDVYVDNGNWFDRVERRSSSENENFSISANFTSVMDVSHACFGLFVDIDNNLYCSVKELHQVFKKSLDTSPNDPVNVVAGIGCEGSEANRLRRPYGIFVTTNFTLYVADCGNDRVQKFEKGQINGTSVAGNGASNTINLKCPSGIVFDADGYIYISDNQNHRIIGSGPTGFRCIIGCRTKSSCQPRTLEEPQALSFDSFGNLYVTEWLRGQIVKFSLASNSCYPESTTTESSHVDDCDKSTMITTNVTEVLSSTSETEFSDMSISSTSMDSTTSQLSAGPFVHSCQQSNKIGLYCNISSNPCQMLEPCKNNGTCVDTNSIGTGFLCKCPSGFLGFHCEIDQRPCRPDRCLNNGTCNETSHSDFECFCQTGWTGRYCERMIDHCVTNPCLNNGVCRSLLRNYSCECLQNSYSGRHCEITSRTITTYRSISMSFSLIALISLALVAIFVIIMDILKYAFGIDPVKKERQTLRLQQQKRRLKRKHHPVAIRFVYVNEPALP